ncbi:toll-like receptor 6 [Aphidius gifuensis]|uniref:toll-like receptor 6 n=1 Tax=Aphidius gifuensis TaxID=684658 RepID=UPI001CDC5D63|nr:toll-like receptor 6 [Aphidius gifuensis]
MKTSRNVRFLVSILKLAWCTLLTDNNTLLSTATLLQKLDIPGHCVENSDTSLTCVYHNLYNESISKYNFSQITKDNIKSLNIICKNSDNQIRVDNFEYLWKLRELSINGCKLIYRPEKLLNCFYNLRNLTIKNSYDIEYNIFFNLITGVFNMTPFIEKIDLSFNKLWQLPESIFCNLKNLIDLNISSNNLKDIKEFGFYDITTLESQSNETYKELLKLSTTSRCLLDIQNLDASNNKISVLSAFGFSKLKRLNTLNVSSNIINIVDDNALHGLRYLKIFDLSSNKIVALPALMFNDARNTIKELWLQNNSIKALAPGLFIEMNQLVSLDLSMNELTSSWLNSNTFYGLIRLVLLNLSWNKLTNIDSELFKDLYTLQILDLHHNHIKMIPSNTFLSMNNLHTLNLAHNNLNYLDAYSLNGLYAVSLVYFDSNSLTSIHNDAFSNCSSMQDLNLAGNNLKNIPIALNNMRMLKTLDIGENKIDKLTGFHGMPNLYGLRIIGNNIVHIKNNDLSQLTSLQILNLSRNKITSIQSLAFQNNKMLQAIRLDRNNLKNISDIFTNISSIIWLNISDNMITELEYTNLPINIQWLDLHKNQINHVSIAPKTFHLQSLDLSFNKLTKIHPNSLPDSIELLLMNNNKLHTIEPQTFHNKVNLTRVDLYANQIMKMDFSVFHLNHINDGHKLPEFYIGGNPLVCDCTMEWLQRINSLQIGKYPIIMDLDSVYCQLPYNRYYSFIPILDAKPSQFLCTYTVHCFALCHCCDFDACDCEMTCPTNCTCYHDESWASNVVDCSNSGYNYLPDCLPMDATEVYLDGNDFGELISHSFIGRKNLQILYTNNSNIKTIYNHTFSGLKRLIILHLENNKITQLSDIELQPLENLKELYLQNNKLYYIDDDLFLALHHLEVLNLRGNYLRTFGIWQLNFNPYLVEISISNNPWMCECTYIKKMYEWISNNKNKILDFNLITCEFNISINESTIDCTMITETTSIEKIQLKMYLSFGLIIFVMIILLFNLIKYRISIKTWIANKCAFRMCYKTAAFEDSEKPFDAYISYSAVDEIFVSQVLVPGLSSYRLCLHYRNLSSDANLTDAVTEAADASRRTILILSSNFLNGEWARFEFKIALKNALTKKGRSVILLCIGGVCFDDLDVDFKKKISHHTVIDWDDKLFWQKLKFAMPEIIPTPVMERPLSSSTSPSSPMHHALWTS